MIKAKTAIGSVVDNWPMANTVFSLDQNRYLIPVSYRYIPKVNAYNGRIIMTDITDAGYFYNPVCQYRKLFPAKPLGETLFLKDISIMKISKCKPELLWDSE